MVRVEIERMKEAVIVSTARTPIGRAFRGAFNDTSAPTLGGHAIAQAVGRAGIEPHEVDDVIVGAAMQAGTTGGNLGRTGGLAAGLPTSVPGMTIDRQCASGLMSIASAAKQIIHDGMSIVVGGGLESISLVQNDYFKWNAEAADETRRSQRAGRVHADARNGRSGGEALPGEPHSTGRLCATKPATHGGGAKGGAFRCRARPVGYHHAGQEQRNGRDAGR